MWVGRGSMGQVGAAMWQFQPISRHLKLRVTFRPSYQWTHPIIESHSQRLKKSKGKNISMNELKQKLIKRNVDVILYVITFYWYGLVLKYCLYKVFNHFELLPVTTLNDIDQVLLWRHHSQTRLKSTDNIFLPFFPQKIEMNRKVRQK